MATLHHRKKIVIAGGTGFLGIPLTARLAAAGHDVVVLSRRLPHGAASPGVRHVAWTPDGSVGAWGAEVDGAGAVVNLAGESIAGARWTAARKARIVDSRVLSTRSLAQAISRSAQRAPAFISASAVGYYGPCGDDEITEASPAGSDFLAGVCVQWEEEAIRAASAQTRVVLVRTGLVLARDGGALPQMLLPFRLFAGGPIGSGRQYWPWIHRDDWLAMVQFALDTPAVNGPMNATAPAPVTNAAFARALGRAMRRPSFLPAPAFALKMLFGEMAESLLLSGQRAIPERAPRLGFRFTYASIDDALRDLFRHP